MKRKIVICAAAVPVVVFAWHLVVSSLMGFSGGDVEDVDGVSVTKNVFTNVLTITIEESPGAFSALGDNMVAAALPSMIERELAMASRRWVNLYAILMPWTATVHLEPPSPASIARYEEEQAARETARQEERTRRERERRKAQEQERLARLAYAEAYITLEGVRVADGHRGSRTFKGLFGTVANNGSQTLDTVRLRVYFLNDEGARIGETTLTPVFSAGWGAQDSPLRPGYRQDFGYDIESEAPSGWAGAVEYEISDIAISGDL